MISMPDVVENLNEKITHNPQGHKSWYDKLSRGATLSILTMPTLPQHWTMKMISVTMLTHHLYHNCVGENVWIMDVLLHILAVTSNSMMPLNGLKLLSYQTSVSKQIKLTLFMSAQKSLVHISHMVIIWLNALWKFSDWTFLGTFLCHPPWHERLGLQIS